ncbi:MAG TPA: rhodanese-like domain-containing protein [Bacteriovoracaceae bacterium]|nr:rhodanese-like domain-containing protein [Bacteriovoracaceae bacterium]
MKRNNNFFEKFSAYEQELERMEHRILELEHRIQELIQIERNHLVRVKNKEEVPDDFILQGKPYNDLTPDRAWKIYQDFDITFILIDVTAADYKLHPRIPEAIHIPWEDFQARYLEIQSQSTPILIISEDGANSVLACEFLVKKGFYNCNNVSGGYKFWRGYRLEELKNRSA